MHITVKSKSSLRVSKEYKIYLKALSIRQLTDIDMIKTEVISGNIIVAKITPLAKRSMADTKRAVDELCEFVENMGGEIARLGDERLVVTPPSIKIWKENESAK